MTLNLRRGTGISGQRPLGVCPYSEGYGRIQCLARDFAGRKCTKDEGHLMVRDAPKRSAPHHEGRSVNTRKAAGRFRVSISQHGQRPRRNYHRQTHRQRRERRFGTQRPNLLRCHPRPHPWAIASRSLVCSSKCPSAPAPATGAAEAVGTAAKVNPAATIAAATSPRMPVSST